MRSGWVLGIQCVLGWVSCTGGEDFGEVWELEPYAVEGWSMDEGILRTVGVVTTIRGDVLEEGADIVERLRLGANLGYRSYVGEGGSGEVSLRGYGEGSGLRVLVLVDGQKVNGPDLGGIEWREIPLEEVEEVEVLRGGQTVIYGQHAVGGVVRIETDGGGEPGFGARLRGGSDGYRMGDIRVGVEAGSALIRIGAQRMNRDGYREHAGSWGELVRGSLRHTSEAGVESVWRGTYGRGGQSYPGPLSYEEALERPRTSRTEGEQGSDGSYTRQSLRLRGVGGWGDWEAQAGWRTDEQEVRLDGQFARRAHEGWRVGFRSKVGTDDPFMLMGMEVLGDELTLRTYDDDRYMYSLSEADLFRCSGGGYLFGQWRIGRTAFSGGGRYERVATQFKHDAYDPGQVNPLDPVIWDKNRTNPQFKPKPDILPDASIDAELHRQGMAWEASLVHLLERFGRIWAGWDRTYRYPVLDEVASYQGYRLSQPLNRDLKAEVGNQLEVGWEWKWTRGAISLAAFESRVEDEIIYDATAGLNVNIGATRRTGVEWAIHVLLGGWRLSAQAEHVQARMVSGTESGRTIPLVAEDRLTVMLEAPLTQRLKAGMDFQYESPRFQGNDYANSGRVLDSYRLIGAWARFRISDDAYFVARISNIFDEAYVSTAFSGSYYPGAGRQWEVSWTWKR